jgi:hypothetical protein
MSRNQKDEWKDLTSELLEARLRSLPNVDVPGSLKARLFATIPDSKAGLTRTHHIQWRPRAWSLGVAAAAVLAVILILAPDYWLSVAPRTLIPNLNDGPTRFVLADQNNRTIVDTNYVDFNSGL